MSRVGQEPVSAYPDQSIARAILLALKGIQFGSVEIIVHDSKVVQIERKEKTRFDHSSARFISGSGNSGSGGISK